LAIDGVQMRGQDPVPQAGRYSLVAPNGKDLQLLFERQDDDTILVTLDGIEGGEQKWLVTNSGSVVQPME
jgi:hypothetical protein